MHVRATRRAAAIALAACLPFAGNALADTVPADGDDVAVGIQDFFEVGPVGTGGLLHAAIWFDLDCNTDSHVDAGQTVSVALGAAQLPAGGTVRGDGARDGGTTIGPVPGDWPADGSLCPSGIPSLRSAEPAEIILGMPADPGIYDYIVNFTRSLSPAGANDAGALRGLTRVFFEITVVADSPPTLQLPVALTVEADETGGAVVSYSATASDAEDPTAPVPVCVPSSGSFFALGDTDVACTVADTAGHQVAGGFTVHVIDTTPPAWLATPSPITVPAVDATGATVTWSTPSARDTVDPDPAIACSPGSGTWFPIGTTSVECRARDASGNSATLEFDVTVTPPPADPPPAPAVVMRPLAPFDRAGRLVTHGSRTVPVRVRLLQDGRPVADGRAAVDFATCAAGRTVGTTALHPAGEWGVWAGLLRASTGSTCLDGTVRLDGRPIGTLRIMAADPPGPSAHASSHGPKHVR